MSARIIVGDALEQLRLLPDESVHCCVTSPLYWGLRDYGAAGQIGLEATVFEYVEKLVSVFHEVSRVLRNDGTLWLNLGDSYATGAGRAYSLGGGAQGQAFRAMGAQVPDSKNPNSGIPVFQPNRMPQAGLKPKDLVGVPWRVAFALQADGWYLRQDIIWAKPNPMPESVRDRCTKAHEYLYLMSRSARYYYDSEAIREPANPLNYRANSSSRQVPPGQTKQGRLDRRRGDVLCDERNKRSVWTVASEPFPEAHFATFPPALIEPCIKAGCPKGGTVLDPFGGSGTTGLVADRLGRDAVLIELNPTYAAMARSRIERDAGLFAEVA